jgi:hypothetical protein
MYGPPTWQWEGKVERRYAGKMVKLLYVVLWIIGIAGTVILILCEMKILVYRQTVFTLLSFALISIAYITKHLEKKNRDERGEDPQKDHNDK